MVEKIKQSVEGLTVSFRFILPMMLAAYWYAYQGDMHAIKDSIADIKSAQVQNVADVKSSQSKIWETLNNFKDDTNKQFNYVYQRLR